VQLSTSLKWPLGNATDETEPGQTGVWERFEAR
jgi:hypothetical protein